MKFNKNAFAASCAFGITLALGAYTPSTLPTAAAAAGGAIVALGVVTKQKDRERFEADRATKISKALSYCYENFKGLVSPQQLAFHAEIELPQAEKLLDSLVTAQNGGQRIQTPMGVIYSFDHPEQILNQLTQNAQAWADSQTNEVLRENAVLRQQLQLLSAAAQSKQMPTILPEQARELFRNNNEVPGNIDDPWTKML